MAPQQTPKVKLFLAGSIDMGAAVDWQKVVTAGLMDLPVAIFNPRRDDWDSTWVQSIHNEKFNEQVSWELAHMEEADLICYYFDPNGKAPITLMELGLHATSGKAVVCCPEGFWRKGNVDVVCARYGIDQVKDLTELVVELRYRIMRIL